MKVLKWTPNFSVNEEPPVAPVWVLLDQLSLFLYARRPLFSIGRLIGTLLKIDAATLSLSCPSVTRICVEIDLRNPLPNRIWIGLLTGGYWQSILYEQLLDYYFGCRSLGHQQSDCGKQQPTLLPKKRIWRVKQPTVDPPVAQPAMPSNEQHHDDPSLECIAPPAPPIPSSNPHSLPIAPHQFSLSPLPLFLKLLSKCLFSRHLLFPPLSQISRQFCLLLHSLHSLNPRLHHNLLIPCLLSPPLYIILYMSLNSLLQIRII